MRSQASPRRPAPTRPHCSRGRRAFARTRHYSHSTRGPCDLPNHWRSCPSEYWATRDSWRLPSVPAEWVSSHRSQLAIHALSSPESRWPGDLLAAVTSAPTRLYRDRQVCAGSDRETLVFHSTTRSLCCDRPSHSLTSISGRLRPMIWAQVRARSPCGRRAWVHSRPFGHCRRAVSRRCRRLRTTSHRPPRPTSRAHKWNSLELIWTNI